MPTPSIPLAGSPADTSHLTTLIVALYIAAPCLIFLVALPVTVIVCVRGSRRRRKERERKEEVEEEKRRRDLEGVLGLGGRAVGGGR